MGLNGPVQKLRPCRDGNIESCGLFLFLGARVLDVSLSDVCGLLLNCEIHMKSMEVSMRIKKIYLLLVKVCLVNSLNICFFKHILISSSFLKNILLTDCFRWMFVSLLILMTFQSLCFHYCCGESCPVGDLPLSSLILSLIFCSYITVCQGVSLFLSLLFI